MTTQRRSFRAPRAASIGVLVLAFVLAGCVAGAGDEPTTAPTSPADSGTPTQTPTETAPVLAQVLFDGDCAAMIPEADVERIIGAADARGSFLVEAATLGGLECGWVRQDTGDWLIVNAYPLDAVPGEFSDRYTEPVCDEVVVGLDYPGCRVAVTGGDAWALVGLTILGQTEGAVLEPPSALADAAAVVAATLATASGNRAEATDAWWEPQCSAIESAVDLGAILGTEDFDQGYPGDAPVSIGEEIATMAGTYRKDCDWYAFVDGDRLAVFGLNAYPGGGQHWAEYLDHTEEIGHAPLEPFKVPGTEDAVRATTSYGAQITVVTDGVNMASIVTQHLEDPDAAIAAILAALAG